MNSRVGNRNNRSRPRPEQQAASPEQPEQVNPARPFNNGF